MRLFIVGLLVISFFQTALLPIDIVVLVLLSRAFVVSDDSNLWLAFGFGLLVSLLMNLPIGSYSIWYLLASTAVVFFKRSNLTSYWLAVVPLLVLLAAGEQGWLWFFFGQSFYWSRLIWEGVLILPIYFAVSYWEEIH